MQCLLGDASAPGAVGEPAEREGRVAHGALFELQHGRDGHEGEGVRRPVAGLAVPGADADGAGRQFHGGDQLTRPDDGVLLGAVAREPVEVGDGHGTLTLRAVQMHGGVERGQGHGHVRRMGGDAVIGVADDREIAVGALPRGAAAAGNPLVAGLRRVLEVRAPRALEQIPAGGRGVAQLAGRAGEQRLGETGVAGPDAGVGGEIAVAHARSDTQPALGVSEIRSNGSRRMSMSRSGAATPSFMRSTRLVPPARYCAPAWEAKVSMA